MRKTVTRLLPILLAAGLVVSPATARRTVVDGNGSKVLSGYCDSNGDDCTPVSLGYSVDFGSGPLTSVLIYGNGLLSFGPKVAVFSDYVNSLADYNVPIVSPGMNPLIDFDSQGVEGFVQSATLTIGAGGVLNADWYSCNTPSDCADHYSLTLTPQAGGYRAVGGFQTLPDVASGGYAIPGVANVHYDILPDSFVIPATFGVVPEPSAWAMAVVGFGLIGGVTRRHRGMATVAA